MHTTLEKLNRVKNKVNEIVNEKQLKTYPKIIVVTKTFPLNKIMPLLENGHIHYAENKIQDICKTFSLKNTNQEQNLIETLKTNCRKAVKEKTGKRPYTNVNLVRV